MTIMGTDDIMLTGHFKLSEFTASATARAKGIDNTPGAEQIENLRNLCENVLEPLRQHIRTPLVISSGYRCPRLNRLVGGVPDSQHQTGEAADIRVPKTCIGQSDGRPHTDRRIGRGWMEWIVSQCTFDQCIWETADGLDYWIHVSCRRDHGLNRQQVISHLQKRQASNK